MRHLDGMLFCVIGHRVNSNKGIRVIKKIKKSFYFGKAVV